MGLFNTTKSQYARLSRALDDNKTLSLGTAAASMRIRREKVDAQLARMTRRGYFGADKPYVDDALHMLVRDRRYADLAALLGALAGLLRALDEAGAFIRRNARTVAQAQKEVRARAVGSFMRDVVDGALNGGAGKVLRDRAAPFVQDLISPQPDMTREERQQAAAATFAQMTTSAEGMRDYAMAHPDESMPRDNTEYVLSARRLVEAWLNYNTAAGASGGANPASETLLALQSRLSNEIAPEMHRRLEALYAFGAYQSPPQAEDEGAPPSQMHADCAQLRALSRQVQSAAVRKSMMDISAALNDILAQLDADPSLQGSSAVRSLRACYLPVTKELLEKYIRYERRGGNGAQALQAMAAAEATLSDELLPALRNLLTTLRAGDAIDLEAQSAALRQKLRLDGLLDDGAPLRP